MYSLGGTLGESVVELEELFVLLHFFKSLAVDTAPNSLACLVQLLLSFRLILCYNLAVDFWFF